MGSSPGIALRVKVRTWVFILIQIRHHGEVGGEEGTLRSIG